jgi:chemotaxis methyl-accepting protein methylase
VLKFGICSEADLDARKLSTFLGRNKFIAVTLYRDLCASDRPDRDELLERILFRFATRNASLKRTQSARFEAFDAAFVEHFRAALEPSRHYAVHDAGVSDGRTAVDFFRRLAAVPGLDFEFVATDYAPAVTAVEDERGRLALVLDPASGEMLQLIWPPFVFNLRKGESPLFYPVNHLARRWLLARRAPALLARLRADADGLRVSTIRLLHPSALALEASDSRFRFERHDLLTPAPRRYDVVRAMNVLNRSYFPEAELARAVGHVADSLVAGGWFVVGANQDRGSKVDGAVYRRVERGFERVFVSGAGSAIDGLVSSVAMSRAA